MKPIKIFKYTTVIILSLIVIISAGAAIFIYFYPEEKLRDLIVENISTSLNKKIDIHELKYSLKGITLKGIKLYSDTTAESSIIASAEDAKLGFSVLALIQRKLNIDQIYLNKFKLNVEFDENGKTNIESFIKSIPEQKEKSSIDMKISRIKLEDAEISIIKPKNIFKPLEGTYNLTSSFRLHNNNSLVDITDCTIRLPLKRGIVKPELLLQIKDNKFRITGKAGVENVSLLWVYMWADTQPAQPFHVVSGEITDLVLTEDEVKGFAKASSTLINSKNMVFADGYCTVDINKKNVFISGATAKTGSSGAFIKKFFFNTSGIIYDFEATDLDVFVSDARPLVKFIPAKIYGKINGSVSYRAGKINCDAVIKNGGYDRTKNIVSGINTDISIKNNVFKKESIRLKVGGHPVTASIACTDPDFKRLFINANTDYFNPDTLLSENNNTGTQINIPVTISGNLNVKTLKIDKFTIKNLGLNYMISGGKINARRIAGNLHSGEINGTGNIDISKHPFRAQSNLNFRNIKVQDLASIDSQFSNRFFGIASGRINLSFPISTNLLEKAKGHVEFTIDSGKVVNTGIQNGLGIWLSELRFKLKDLEFSRIYGNAEIMGNAYNIKSFVFKSENIRLKLEGPLTRKLQTPRMQVNLEFTDHFIQDIPRPAVMSLRKYLKGRWYVIPFRIKGDITESGNIKMLN